MSVFLADIAFDGATVSQVEVQTRLGRLAHIAPGSTTLHAAPGAVLGHRLLVCRDDSNAEHQPLVGPSGVVLVGHARLDGRDTLKRTLGFKGPDDSVSDPGLLLAAWERWGQDCVDRIAGDFSFVVWDAREKYLFAARDRLGIMPLYYHQAGARLRVSNTLTALLPTDGSRPELDENSLVDYLVHGHFKDLAATSFRQIRQLRPSDCGVFSADRLQCRRYWNPETPEPVILPDADLVRQFRALFEQSVEERIRFDRCNVPVSGGMDSAAVVTVASAYLRRRGAIDGLDLWHVEDADMGGGADLGLVERLAEQSGAKLKVRHLPERNGPDKRAANSSTGAWWAPELPWLFDTRLARGGVVEMAQYAPVALSGQAGDQLFSVDYGQPRRWIKHGEWLRYVSEASRFALRHGRRPPLGLGVRSGLRRRWEPQESPHALGWLAPARRRELEERGSGESRDSGRAGGSAPDRNLSAKLRSGFWQQVISLHRPEALGSALEFRHPFFNIDLANFLERAVPPRWQYRKTLLREAFAGILDEGVRRLPKKVYSMDSFRENLISAGSTSLDFNVFDMHNLHKVLDLDRCRDLLSQPVALSHAECYDLQRVVDLFQWAGNIPGTEPGKGEREHAKTN